MEDNNLINNETPKLLSSDEKNWAMFCHLSALVGSWVPLGYLILPLVLWLVKREEYAFVDFAGKESVNFQISMTIYYLIGFVLIFALVGIPLLFGLALFHLVVTIIASIKTSQGEYYRYPMSIKFIS